MPDPVKPDRESFWHTCVVAVLVVVGLVVAAVTNWAATLTGLELSAAGLVGAYLFVKWGVSGDR